ncbi:MAG TPA: LemA family protein [Candidatus Kapabacteria bacterium]|nr:LemA family protein [Candidatus Kapabacteria bacterium]
MKKTWLIVGSIAFVIIVIYAWWSSTYNGMVQLDQGIKESIGNLASAYQRRSDLIPNLVETVKGSVQAERGTLEAVVNARSRATAIQLTPEAMKDPKAVANFEQAQGQLSGALSRLLVTVEKYPDLRSQENFQTLMNQIEGSENRVSTERKNYNERVKEFNVKILSFPASLIAGMGGFKEYTPFQAAAGTENAPKVNFNASESPATAPADQTPPPATPAPERGTPRPKQ